MNFDTIKQQLIGDERAVSPVIGVILMVAITVILAAVIGTFVLGLGENVQSQAPQASLSFSDNSANFDDGDSTEQAAFNIEHAGGEDLSADNVIINIRKKSDNSLMAKWEGSWQAGGAAAPAAQISAYVNTDITGTNTLVTDDVVGTGDRIVISNTPGDGTDPDFEEDTQYTITLIDKGSGQTIGSGTVTLR